MRKVEILKRKWNKEIGAYEFAIIQKQATFHQFGVNYEEFEGGPGNYTTAIIEHEDGKVENIDCDLIRFIKG